MFEKTTITRKSLHCPAKNDLRQNLLSYLKCKIYGLYKRKRQLYKKERNDIGNLLNDQAETVAFLTLYKKQWHELWFTYVISWQNGHWLALLHAIAYKHYTNDWYRLWRMSRTFLAVPISTTATLHARLSGGIFDTDLNENYLCLNRAGPWNHGIRSAVALRRAVSAFGLGCSCPEC